jgi:hypothetical protein
MSVELEVHQLNAVEKGPALLRKHRLLYLIFYMRKGKTLTSLFICDQCLKNTPDAHVLFVTESEPIPSIKSDYALMENPSFGLTVINYESLHKVDKLKFNILIVDESHRLGTYPKPNTYAVALKKMAAYKAVIYLSATPTPETGSQIYHQLDISTYSPFKQWPTFYLWAQEFVKIRLKKMPGREIREYDDCDKNKTWPYVAPFSLTVGEKEGSKLTEIKEHVIEVRMSAKTVSIYNALKYHKIYINDEGKAAIANSGGELDSKFSQICSGTIKYDETIAGTIYEPGEIIDTSKAELIKQKFEGQKIAILYRFVAEGEMLKQFFPNYTQDWQEFQNRTDLIYIKQIRSARVGIRLDSADAIVMFNIEHSALSYIQGMARGQSMFREKPMPVYWIFSNLGVEAAIYKNLKENKSEMTSFYYADSTN